MLSTIVCTVQLEIYVQQRRRARPISGVVPSLAADPSDRATTAIFDADSITVPVLDKSRSTRLRTTWP